MQEACAQVDSFIWGVASDAIAAYKQQGLSEEEIGERIIKAIDAAEPAIESFIDECQKSKL